MRAKKLIYKLCVTAFVLSCAYTTYTYKLPPYIWLEHLLLLAHAWADNGTGLMVSTAFWPISGIYFLSKYLSAWRRARKVLKKSKSRKK